MLMTIEFLAIIPARSGSKVSNKQKRKKISEAL